ncbi:MAG: 3-hexulose-6-phosphate synthase [Elusimicrobiota bacterium]
MGHSIIQVALDFVDTHRALKLAEEIDGAGIDWLEAGTPLIKSAGLDIIRALHKKFPQKCIVADLKIMDVGRIEVEMAVKAGAGVVTVLGCASDETIKESVNAGRNYGAKVMADMIEVKDISTRVKQLEKLRVDIIGLHIPIDEQMKGKINFGFLKDVRKITSLPVAVAGGINSANIAEAVRAGADILIVGGAITKSACPADEVKKLLKAIRTKTSVKNVYYQRAGLDNVREVLNVVSAANVSDAMHRAPALTGVYPLVKGTKLVGPVVTVSTLPGDWAKPVQAIDLANEGDVLVVDTGGVGPAVWGELATQSAVTRKLAGVIVHGAVRDTMDIVKIKLPIFTKTVQPNAGEPKGYGEINVPLIIGGIKVSPGDWVIGDDDGVIVLPKNDVVEIANRAMNVLEHENRLRKEIKDGSTLAKVTNLLKWEKK